MVEHQPIFGPDKEVASAAKPVVEIWLDAYREDINRKGLDDKRKQEIKAYLKSLDPRLREALTQREIDGKSILTRTPSTALKQAKMKKAA